jgi:hypothetical protein
MGHSNASERLCSSARYCPKVLSSPCLLCSFGPPPSSRQPATCQPLEKLEGLVSRDIADLMWQDSLSFPMTVGQPTPSPVPILDESLSPAAWRQQIYHREKRTRSWSYFIPSPELLSVLFLRLSTEVVWLDHPKTPTGYLCDVARLLVTFTDRDPRRTDPTQRTVLTAKNAALTSTMQNSATSA